MDSGFEDISLDVFLTWKVDSLRDFLTKRGLTKDGSKQELAALCFAVNNLRMPVVPTTSEILKQNVLDYAKLLCVEGTKLPDPFMLHKDWITEDNGISLWPPIYISDIITYLTDHDKTSNLKAVVQDYKVGKAYEYFQNGFLKELFYHAIAPRSKYCFLRSKCVPSQRVKDEPHNLWVCAEKSTGVIVTSYCSCAAGLGRTCNHIAGLLFRVEAANKLGISACTSSSCSWDTPAKKEFTPTKIKDMVFKKSRHSEDQKRPLVSGTKSLYQPIDRPDSTETLKTFVSALKESLPSACIFKGIYNPDKQIIRPKRTLIDLSPYMMDKYMECPDVYNEKDVATIEEGTRGQSVNESWLQLRDGRLTASSFYSIHTGVLGDKSEECYYPLIGKLLGYKKVNQNIKSLKHGRETEPEAKRAYTKVIKQASHSNVVIQECGLIVDKDNPYLGATPDLLVSCDCCGLGVVEIKCPLVSKCANCSNFCMCKFPDYLLFCEKTNTFQLKKRHQYYAQVQGQMAISRRNFCDFFVYTCNGSIKIRISIDKEFCNALFHSLKHFFHHFIVPELKTRKIRALFSESSCGSDKENDQSCEAMDIETVFFCPMCNSVVNNSGNVQSYRDQSICCDLCDLWYHFRCVKMTKQTAMKLKQWTCPKCNAL